MDRNKLGIKRGPKIKPLPPPGDFIVLGSKSAKPSVESLDLKLGAGPTSTSSSSSSSTGAKAGSNGDRKRDATGRNNSPTTIGGPLAKKQKLTVVVTTSNEAKKERRGETWDAVALEVDPSNLIGQITAAEEKLDDERCERLLCGAVKQMRSNRAKPDPPVYLGLMFLAKTKPTLFCSDQVTEGFSSLLKRDPALGFKSKGNSLVSVLACNVLLSAYQEDINWPDCFVRMYLDDALGERLWVDRSDCKGFVDNILTAYNTKPSPKGLLVPELNFKSDVACSPPASNADADDDLFESMQSIEGVDSSDVPVFPRYTRSSETVEQFTVETMREQVSRRQPMDNVSRNVLKVLASTAGLPEIRLLVAQKLEMWMQNPKLTRPAQDILLAVCVNCNRHDQLDIEVISHLLKIRLKTKPVINHYLQCIRELLGQHSDNAGTVLQHIIYNELSTSRNPNNMALLTVLFQHSPERAARLLAETFREVLDNRDDYLRAVRVLFREIVRSLRHDLNFAAFCLGLMRERKESEAREQEQALRDRMLLSLADLITLAIFLSIAPAVREAAAANARGDRRELGVLRAFQRQVTEIQRDAVWWLHTSVARLKPGKAEFLHCLQKVLFVEQPEHYYNKDNWPAESERAIMMRLASEVPVVEDTLIRILVMGLSKDHPIGASEALDLADQLVKRAAQLHADDLQVIEVQRLELFDAIFNLCTYHHPENIALPPGYRAPELAISALYWKAWITLLIVTAHNPSTFGLAAWESYPTLRCFMEMCITNHFAFPPPTMGEKAEEMRAKEAQICQLERQDIMEFENHLAAASMHVVITESNSLLLAQLTSIDPGGACRRPPAHVLEQLESLNRSLKLGHLLCRTRNPDFLLNIIQCQGTSQYMPWLAELVESSEGALDVLPVQCLCEFLLTDGWSEESQRPTSVSDGDREETKAEKAERIRRREKRHKQRQLQRHLRNIVSSDSPDPQPTREVLDYFLGRLGSQQMTARRQAVRGLVLVLSPPGHVTDEEDEEEIMERRLNRADGDSTDDECAWLLRHLPALHHFESVRSPASVALRRACKVESDPVMVSAYIRFLAEYAPCEQPSDLADLAFDVAHMIIERTTIVNYLLPALGEGGVGQESAVMSALVAIFVQYLRKAREPSGAEYSWSEAQDHVLIQWSTGEVATMQIFVVHAMIVLLVYGPTSDSHLFDELLEAWFPANASPPQAFLVDTSEEALLFPDWLKLRMMRSNVEELVDAALRDLEPSQLVLFIQSFGIPVRSVAKLLRALDSAVELNSYLVEQAVVDKGYMSKFVRVQQQRGASGGELFARFLASEPGDGGEDSAAEEVEEQERRKPLPLVPTPLVVPPLTPLSLSTAFAIQDVAPRLIGLFDLDPSGARRDRAEGRDTLRCLQKRLALEARSGSLDKPYTQQVISFFAIVLHPTDGHFLVRRLLAKHAAAGPLFRLLLSSCCRSSIIVNAYASRLREICQTIVAFAAAADISSSPLVVLIRANPFVAQTLQSRDPASGSNAPLDPIRKMDDQAVEKVVRETLEKQPARLERVTRQLVRMAMEADQCNKIVTAFTRILVDELPPSVQSVTTYPANGLLIDWLELLETEVIGSGDAARSNLQRSLLFGRRPSPPGNPDVDNSGQAVCRPYLLATLTHRASWSTLRNCVRLLVGPDDGAIDDVINRPYTYDATAVLDFLNACMHIPKLWQGRDKHIPKHIVVEDILAPTELQVLTMAGHVLEETRMTAPGGPPDGARDPIERRLPLLLHCCNDRGNVVRSLATYLLIVAGNGGPLSQAARRLLLYAYLQVPRLVRFVPDAGILFADNAVALRTPSRLDPVSHTLLSALASLDAVKDWKDKLRDVDLACRKLASAHPLLVLRQLPMIATSLRGRAHFDYSAFRARHHLAFFVSVAGLLELLQPHVFRQEYSTAFEDVCGSYLDLIRSHGFNSKELAGLISRFLNLLMEFMAYDSRRALPLAQKHAPMLHDLLDLFPEHPALRAITTALSLPRQLPPFEGDSGGGPSTTTEEPAAVLHSFAPPQQPPAWNPAHLQPIAVRLQNLDSVEDVLVALHDLDNISNRKVAVLEFFTDDMKRLMSHPSESCRNLSYSLLMKLLKRKPDLSKDFLDTYLNCYESDHHDVIISALERLSEFVLLCQEHANLILQKTFKLNLTTNINTVPYIGEIIMLLNMQSGI